MSLRWRLTLYYAALSALILLLGGGALFLALRASLRQALDRSLQDAAGIAASQVGGDAFAAPESPNDLLLTRLPGSTVIRVFDAQGRETDRFGRPPVSAPLRAGFTTIGETRVYTEALPDGGFIQVMRSEVETLQAIGRTQKLLLLGVSPLLLLGVGLGYLLADRALLPVDRVARLAGAIAASGRYQERVPQTPGKDEMARLTGTVNAMLSRLEATIERERAFALAAAHELRTPLTLLHGRATLSLEKERTPEQYRAALQLVARTSQEMTGLVESLLALARTNQPPPPDPVDLADIAAEIVQAAASEARQRGVDVVQGGCSALTRGDARALQLAATNLLYNALKYGGKKVWVSTGVRGEEAFLEVCDDGPGIPEGELERLRQPFQRGAGLQGSGGAGLGLAITGAVAEGHGGRLELGRGPQGGLRAAVWLPHQTLML
ncbi:MAG: two-component sensor histidine kinase [Meiothermus sp.]